MNAEQFYKRQLDLIQVGQDEIKSAREKRDELADKAVEILRIQSFRQVRRFPAGALAAGLQIKPLNDVDLVVEADPRQLPDAWAENPLQALQDICGALRERTRYTCETTAHAVKVTFPDEDFTADIVFGVTRAGGGLRIPHCPSDEQHSWIDTHPEAHARLVRQRNRDTANKFARSVRIAKSLNRFWAIQCNDGKKPVSSFHLVAMAWHGVQYVSDLPNGVADVFQACAEMVKGPTPDPSGVGGDLFARDPAIAFKKFDRAASIAREAVTAGDRAGALLETLFGDQRTVASIFDGKQLGYTTSGGLTTSLGPGVATIPQRPAYGDAER